MKKNILIIAIVIALLIVAGALFYWFQPKLFGGDQVAAVGSAGNAPASGIVSTAEINSILAKVGRLMILPTGETPQIARIDNPTLASQKQPFLSGARKGDLLIVYPKALKAIVYSPSRNLIVNVGPVSVNPEKTTTSTPAPTKTATTSKTTTKK